jgi:hypothetical protein
MSDAQERWNQDKELVIDAYLATLDERPITVEALKAAGASLSRLARG